MKFMLNVQCVECERFVTAPFPIERDEFARQLAEQHWYLSVLTPPGQGQDTPIVFGALCQRCAKRISPPELLKAAEEARSKLLS